MGNLSSISRVTIRWKWAVNVQLMEIYGEFIVNQQSNYKLTDKKIYCMELLYEAVCKFTAFSDKEELTD
jgi:hypothetical protein